MEDKIFELHDQGFTVKEIARKARTSQKKVRAILGNAADKGLGDTIEQITEATGIKAVVEQVFGDDCGCKARKEVLNKLFPNRKLNDLLDHQYEYLNAFFATPVTSVNRSDQEMLIEVYNHVFNAKRKISSCSTCVANVVKELKKVYERANEK